MVGLDHHCPFVNNCVGRGNRRLFVWFTIVAAFGCGLMAVWSLYLQTTQLCPHARLLDHHHHVRYTFRHPQSRRLGRSPVDARETDDDCGCM